MSKFNFIKTDIPDVQIIEPTVFGDDRGYFMETYQIDEFAAAQPPQRNCPRTGKAAVAAAVAACAGLRCGALPAAAAWR